MVDDERVFVESIFRSMRDYLLALDNQPLILSAAGKDDCETLTKLMMRLKKSGAIKDYKSVIPSATTKPTAKNGIMNYQFNSRDDHGDTFALLLDTLRSRAKLDTKRLCLYGDALHIAGHPRFFARYGNFNQYVDGIRDDSNRFSILGHSFSASKKDYPFDNAIAFLAYHTSNKLAESVSYEIVGNIQLANLEAVARMLSIDFNDPNLGSHRFYATLRYNSKRVALDLEVNGHVYKFNSSGDYAASTRILEYISDKNGNFDGKVFIKTDIPEEVIGVNNAGKAMTTIMRAEIYRKDLATFVHPSLDSIAIDGNAYLSESQLVLIKNSKHLKKKK